MPRGKKQRQASISVFNSLPLFLLLFLTPWTLCIHKWHALSSTWWRNANEELVVKNAGYIFFSRWIQNWSYLTDTCSWSYCERFIGACYSSWRKKSLEKSGEYETGKHVKRVGINKLKIIKQTNNIDWWIISGLSSIVATKVHNGIFLMMGDCKYGKFQTSWCRVSSYLLLFMCFLPVQYAVCVRMEQFCASLFVVLGVCPGSS